MNPPRTISKKTKRPLLLLLFLAITLIFAVSANFAATDASIAIAYAQEPTLPANRSNPSRERLSSDQQYEIIKKNVRIRKLQEGIIDHKIKILGSRKKERTLLGDLETIEKKLQAQKKMLATLRTESAMQEEHLAEKQEYLLQVLAEKRAHQAHVKNRLAAFYRLDSVGLMNVVFSSKSLPEILDFKEYFGLMVQHDHTIVQDYLARIKESNRAREEHAREKLRLMKLATEVEDNEERLSSLRAEKNLLLKQVHTEQHLYEQAVSEIEDAAADLAATLQRLRTAAEPKPVAAQPAGKGATEQKEAVQNPPATTTGFPARKGLLDPPVPGTVIVRFGEKVKGKFDSSTIASGIDIRVHSGLEIKSVYAGRVVHSGYLRGYGNLIIIDHGQQYFSLISRGADFYKNEGTRVEAGETIGTTGAGDPLYGEGLHFEIRKGSSPEDPLLWLRQGALAIETP